MRSICVICSIEFKEGDQLQAFLRCADDPSGSWTTPVTVDAKFQERCERNGGNIKRKHTDCKPQPPESSDD